MSLFASLHVIMASMKLTAKFYLNLFTVPLLITGINSISSTYAQSTSAASAWASNTAYAKQLGPEVNVDEFSVTPPASYHLEKTQKAGKYNIHDDYTWSGPKRPDGSVPSFRVEVYHWLPGVPHNGTSDQWVTRAIASLNKNQNNPVHSPIMDGQIHGMGFARMYFHYQGDLKPSVKKSIVPVSHGFEYMSSQGPILVSVICEDVEPHYKSTLDMMEAAALTLHQ